MRDIFFGFGWSGPDLSYLSRLNDLIIYDLQVVPAQKQRFLTWDISRLCGRQATNMIVRRTIQNATEQKIKQILAFLLDE